MKSNLSKKLVGVKPGTLYAGMDLAPDRNEAVVLSERAEQLDRFGFPNKRSGYDCFHRRLEPLRVATWTSFHLTSKQLEIGLHFWPSAVLS